jgi:hypothetical protein
MKTSELTGPALDWAVAKCEGRREPELINNFHVAWYTWGNVHYSTNWAHGGPIIERQRIYVKPNSSNKEWRSYVLIDGEGIAWAHFGPTPLIAAMRCYVASKLGDEVDVPEELA